MTNNEKLRKLHAQIQEKKKRLKDLRKMFKDELSHNQRYQDVLEEAAKIREEKKRIEVEVREGHPKDVQELEELVLDLKTDQEVMSDLAFNMVAKNESIELTDENDVAYEAIITVRFKKS